MEFKKVFITDSVFLTKKQTRIRLSGQWGKAFISIFINFLIIGLISVGTVLTAQLGDLIYSLIVYSIGILLILMIFSPLMHGMTYIFIQVTRGGRWDIRDIFSGYACYWKCLRLGMWIFAEFLTANIPLLISLILIGKYISDNGIADIISIPVPALILIVIIYILLVSIMPMFVYVRYSQALFLSVDNSYTKTRVSITNSMNLIKWNEKRMIYLVLSFGYWIIPILLLAALMCCAVFFLENAALMAFCLALCIISEIVLMCFLCVYFCSASAVFYEKLTNKLSQKKSVKIFDETVII